MIVTILSSAATAPFDPVAATDALLATVGGAARARSDAYFEGGYWLILWNALIGAAIVWGTLRAGLVRRLSGWAGRVTKRRRWLHVLLFAFVYALLLSLLMLPWSFYTGWAREHQYGMSNQSLTAWLGDQAKLLPINALLLALLFLAVLPLYWRLPRSWWAWGTAICAAFLAIGMILAPVTIMPLLNTYRPMPPGPVRDRILSMARANGVPADNVYVVDESRQTKRVSANVSGLGPTIRVSLNDNLLARGTPGEIAQVMGHELGHYVLNHIASLLVAFTGVALLYLLGLHFGVPALLGRWGGAWGIGRDDPGVIAPALIVITLLALPLTPLRNTIIRFHEAQADAFGINASRAPDGAVRAYLQLAEYRKLAPGPVEEFLLYDHPSGRTRILQAMRWKAEHLGEPGIE